MTMKNSIATCVGAALSVAAISGCSNNNTATPTQKEQATRQWNQTRAGVMAGLAKDQFNGGSFDKARATVNEAIQADPENASLYILAAQIAIEQDSLIEADKNVTKARLLAPTNAEALYISGVIAQRWQRNEEALNYYTQAENSNPSELAFLLARAETLVVLDRKSEALSALKDKLVYFDNSSAIRDAIGQLLLEKGQVDDAADMFRQASILSPNDLSIKERYATTLFGASKFEAAADVLTDIVSHADAAKRADLWAYLGECRMQQGRAAESRAAFQKAAEIDPSSNFAWMGVAKAALLLNDLPRADAASKRAAALKPERADVQLVEGYVSLRQGKLEEAMVAFRKASALDPSDSVSLCMLGKVMEQQGNNSGALNMYAKALRVNPSDDLAASLMTMARIDD